MRGEEYRSCTRAPSCLVASKRFVEWHREAGEGGVKGSRGEPRGWQGNRRGERLDDYVRQHLLIYLFLSQSFTSHLCPYLQQLVAL